MIEFHPERKFVDVGLGKAGVKGKLHLGFVERDGALLLEGVDRPFEEFAIEMETDGGDLSRLLDAEDIAGAADLKIPHGDLHPAAVAARFDEGVEPFARRFWEADVFGDQEIGIGGAIPAADAAAKLVEVCEAVGVGAVDENRICIGNIDPVFDDGRCKEDVDLPLLEAMEQGVDVIGVHLAVDDADAGGRNEFLYYFAFAVDRFDPVVDEKCLSSPRQFSHEGILDEFRIGFCDD